MWWSDKHIIPASLLIAILVSLPLSYTGLFERAENWVKDYVQVVWGEQADFDDIVIIDIDEISMRALNSQLGSWPYDRQVFAATVDYLRQAGAEKIVFDILFADARDGDQELLQQLRLTDETYLAAVLLHDYRFTDDKKHSLLKRHAWSVGQPPELNRKGLMLPQKSFLEQANMGIISVFPDQDGVVRDLPLLINVDDEYFPAMMLSLVSGQNKRSIDFDWTRNQAVYAGYRWPVSDKGAVTLKYPVNFADLPVIPFYKFLLSAYGAGDIALDTYRGKTVFIGSTASILGDYTYIPGSSGRVHGLGVLALAYHGLKHGSLLITSSFIGNSYIVVIMLLVLLVAIRWKGIRPVPLLAGYLLALLLSFSVMVLLYQTQNIQTWIVLPVLTATLFVVLAIFAKSLGLQIEGQRLMFEKQAAEEARDLKARFLAYMTHELRTPLTAIMGYNRLLLDGNVQQQEQKNYLQIIEENSEHLLNLINNILDQSRIEANQLSLVRDEHDIHGLLNDVKVLMQPIADSKGIAIRLEVSDSVPQTLVIDRTRVKQIVINLVGNALKFTEKGHVDIQVDWHGDLLQVSVEDTGPGIPESDLQSIFESFQQVESVIASEVTGSGLGLTISTNLARLMGGRIDVSSEPGKGTIFTLVIQAQHGMAETSACDTGSEPQRPADPYGNYILLAEDSKDSSTLITMFLDMAGYQVKLATNGQQAIEIVEEESPGIILMDMHMPVMDGETATREIRSKGYNGPILALTASTDEDIIANMRAAGSDGEIIKPVQADSLIRSVARYLLPVASE
jgi:signal transduction histidine kinase